MGKTGTGGRVNSITCEGVVEENMLNQYRKTDIQKKRNGGEGDCWTKAAVICGYLESGKSNSIVSTSLFPPRNRACFMYPNEKRGQWTGRN